MLRLTVSQENRVEVSTTDSHAKLVMVPIGREWLEPSPTLSAVTRL